MSFAWNVVATAARLCQNSGYHREITYNSSLSPAEKSKRKWLFWALYGFDHALALNFGQPPNIQDYDITLDMPRLGDNGNVLSHELWLWVGLARWQGDVYEHLYSAKAQRAPQEARIGKARELAKVGHEHMEKFKVLVSLSEKPSITLDFFADHQRGVTASVLAVMYSILTLIFKVIPPTAMKSPPPLQFSEDCIAAARAALTTLNEAWTHIRKDDDGWRMFMHWYNPFCTDSVGHRV
jgi:Fungal specific transcription factor domain